MKFLVDDYCKDVYEKDYEVTDEVLEKVLKRLANDKPGRDLVTGLWLKRLKSIKEEYKQELTKLLNNEMELPAWMLISKTILLPKSEMTIQAQNCRPIALQTSMYKVYTAILAELSWITVKSTEEQAAGKRGSWACTDQLLVNKMICDEVASKRRDLVTVWFDYKKAFDSIPHSWLIKSLELAKVPEKLSLPSSN